MLNVMRENAGSWIIKVLLIAIVVVFIFWGVGSFRDKPGGRIAMVNGESILYEDWIRTYNNILENIKRRFGDNLTPEMLKMLNLKEQALEQLINTRLLVAEAGRLNFSVSEKELVDAVRKMPVFQSNGTFNPRLYRNVLVQNKWSPEDFEAITRDDMLVDKLRTFINETVNVTDAEAMDWYRWNRASVAIDYALVKPDDIADVTLSDEEINAYYEEHKADYETAPKVKVNYLRFDPGVYLANVDLPDEEVRARFEENVDSYFWPKTVEASHILLRVGKDAPESEVEDKRKQAEALAVRAKSGEDFAELAKTYSEGPSKNSGGYLGAFEKKDMVGPFAEKAFSMAEGEISDPVRTPFGWHIILVEKINEERPKTFDEVQGEIRQQIENSRAEQLAYEAAESAFDDSLDLQDLSEVASLRKLELYATEFFPKAGPVPGIEDTEKFAAAAFELGLEEISDVLSMDGSFFILQPTERQEAKIPPLEEVLDAVKKDLAAKKKEEAAQQKAEKILAELKNPGEKDPDTGEENAAALKTTDFFTRYGAIPDIGYEREIIDAAFMLSKENPLPEKVIKGGGGGFYVIRFKDRKPPETKGFDGEKEQIRKRLLSQKQSKAFGALVTHLRSKGDITVKKDFM